MIEFLGSPLYCVFKLESPISCDPCVYMYGMCIYVWFVWYDVCVCVGTHMPQCLGEGQWTISSFTVLLSTCCETGSLDHCCMDLTLWPKSFWEIFLLLLPISGQECWHYRCVLPCWLSVGSCWDHRCVLPCWLFMSLGVSNTGPHTCTASNLIAWTISSAPPYVGFWLLHV